MELRQGVELRADGRTLTGAAIRYGDVSPSHRERFAPGSLVVSPDLAPTLGHRTGRVLAYGDDVRVEDRQDALIVEAHLPRTKTADRALDGVQSGRYRGWSVEFVARRESRDASGVRVIEAADLPGLALVDHPSYPGSGVEARQGDDGALTLVEGPAGSGKSQIVARLLEEGEADVQADLTAQWVALTGVRRGPDGRYPIRDANDPTIRTGMAPYMRRTAVRQGARSGLRVVVTSGTPGEADAYRAVADELGVPFNVRTVDPGEAVVRERLADADGVMGAECEAAVGRWYGARRPRVRPPRIRRPRVRRRRVWL